MRTNAYCELKGSDLQRILSDNYEPLIISGSYDKLTITAGSTAVHDFSKSCIISENQKQAFRRKITMVQLVCYLARLDGFYIFYNDVNYGEIIKPQNIQLCALDGGRST